MDEPIYLLSARLLSFLAGFLFVLGIKFFLANRKKSGPWSDPRLPFTFRGFPNEIKLFKDTAGTWLRQRFPAKNAKIERDLKLAALRQILVICGDLVGRLDGTAAGKRGRCDRDRDRDDRKQRHYLFRYGLLHDFPPDAR